MISNWTNLVARRDLLRELVVSDLKANTAQSRIGWLWWLLDPVLMMLIYWAIVSMLLGRGKAQYAPYPLFIFCALITWKHFSRSVGQSVRVLRSKEPLIKSVPFPTMLLPISVASSGFAYFFFGFVVLLGAALIWPGDAHDVGLLPMVQLLPLMACQFAIVAGVCLTVSCAGVMFRDLRNFSSHLLRIGFYLSPGLYGLDLVRSSLSARLTEPWATIFFNVYLLNPFAIIITGYRHVVMNNSFLPGNLWAMLFVETAVISIVGFTIYQHYDRRVIKFL